MGITAENLNYGAKRLEIYHFQVTLLVTNRLINTEEFVAPRYASDILDRRVEVFGLSLQDDQWRMPENPRFKSNWAI